MDSTFTSLSMSLVIFHAHCWTRYQIRIGHGSRSRETLIAFRTPSTGATVVGVDCLAT